MFTFPYLINTGHIDTVLFESGLYQIYLVVNRDLKLKFLWHMMLKLHPGQKLNTLLYWFTKCSVKTILNVHKLHSIFSCVIVCQQEKQVINISMSCFGSIVYWS